ncbi:DNA-binding transcriptional regulator, LysR family [Oscillibacter sp. PC13]|uniref:LysR family transcriptional regulator n=1 Tax=Oscillibacter sp. PC13 TaxID=1855299 RepID=UPI0008E91E0C|nr:LysR family transcriptional regulator [Oscillibacter sp. PC13]SFQ17164.1 DNA-binding transcriptional regulator, LysR family [Oscillibacter sp. PC13]
MTLQQLRYIVELSKHDSISRAASALFVTQPSISKAVRDLEAELQIQILSRTNKGILFTNAGNELLFYAKVLLEQSESVKYHFNPQNSNRLTKLSISSQHHGYVIAALNRLLTVLDSRKYELIIREGRTSDVIDDVSVGKSIIGILSYNDLAKSFFERSFMTKDLDFTPLFSFHQHIYIRKGHPLAACSSVTYEQLTRFPFVTYQQDDVPLYFSESDIVSNDISQRIYVKDRGTMNEILAYTDCYNVGTGCITPHYMHPNIISIPIQDGHRIQIGYLRQHEVSLPEDVRLYLDYLEDTLRNSFPR